MKPALAHLIVAAIIAGLVCMGLWLAHLAYQRGPVKAWHA